MSLKKNIKWVALSQLIKIGIQLVSLTVLTRFIAPSEYGLMAMATVVTNFTLIIRDLGTSAAIIQRNELNQVAKSTVFWLNLFMGLLIFIIVTLAAPLISTGFKAPALASVLFWISLSFPIASSTSTHQALLERESKFKSIAEIDIRSSCIGLVVALFMANQGMGVYSLVGQTLIVCILSSIQLWYASAWQPTFEFSKKELRNLFGFSGNISLFNFVNYFSRNADSIIIGHYFSAIILGSYSLAYRVMLFPLQNLTSITTRSLYPLMSRQQDDPLAVKAMYLRVMAVIASITAPMMAGLAVLSEPFAQIAFGNQWPLVPTLLIWLAPTGFIQSLVSTTGSVLMANDKTRLLMKLGLMSAITQISAFILGAQFDVQTISKFYLIANIINSLPAIYFTMKSINGKGIEIMSVVFPPIICSIIMSVFLIAIQKAFAIEINMIIFALIILSGLYIYIFIYRLLFAQLFGVIAPEIIKKIVFI